MAVYETCFRDRGIDRSFFCVLLFYSPSLVRNFLFGVVGFVYKAKFFLMVFPHPLSFLPLLVNTMSSPSSSYVQVGLDNLERPLNRSPSPRAQVRGFDWSSLFVD